ncbi:hypothetical protein KCU65_g359, partial [Aureobasidium melanogenum]
MQVFACGLSAAPTRLLISFPPTTPHPTHHNGALLLQTSPALIATSLHTSRTSPSSPTSIYAAVGQVQPVCTQQSMDVPALVQTLSRTMPQLSRTRIGSLGASEFGQLHRYCFADCTQDTLTLIRNSYVTLTSCLVGQQLRSNSLCCSQFIVRRHVDDKQVQNILCYCQPLPGGPRPPIPCPNLALRAACKLSRPPRGPPRPPNILLRSGIWIAPPESNATNDPLLAG